MQWTRGCNGKTGRCARTRKLTMRELCVRGEYATSCARECACLCVSTAALARACAHAHTSALPLGHMSAPTPNAPALTVTCPPLNRGRRAKMDAFLGYSFPAVVVKLNLSLQFVRMHSYMQLLFRAFSFDDFLIKLVFNSHKWQN